MRLHGNSVLSQKGGVAQERDIRRQVDRFEVYTSKAAPVKPGLCLQTLRDLRKAYMWSSYPRKKAVCALAPVNHGCRGAATSHRPAISRHNSSIEVKLS